MAGGLIVVGASLAGLRAAEAARREGYIGAITLIGAESHLPYHRPPLSKAYLGAAARADYFTTLEDVAAQQIDLRLGTTVTGLDPAGRQIIVGDERLPFDSLVIATGAAPRVLASISRLSGVHSLRTLDDADAIRESLRPGLKVVIIGAGFLGSEIASSAQERGATVTILEAAAVPLVRAVGEVVGAAISRLHERNGVRLVCGAQIAKVESQDGRVTSVRLGDGEVFGADLIVVGIGAAPSTGWLVNSGIELNPVDGSVMCDAYLETSIPGVFAAGDVAHWPNGLMEASMRLENWTNAADQGKWAGVNASIPEKRTPFETVPYFWSDWYKNRIQFVGSAIAENVSFVSGDPDGDRFVAVYRSGDRIIGVATLNEPRRIMKFRRLISQRGTVQDVAQILDASPPVAVT